MQFGLFDWLAFIEVGHVCCHFAYNKNSKDSIAGIAQRFILRGNADFTLWHVLAGVLLLDRPANNKTHRQWRTLRPTQMLISTILVNERHGLLEHHREATGKRSNNNKPFRWRLEMKKKHRHR
jgi:hypothetical protein